MGFKLPDMKEINKTSKPTDTETTRAKISPSLPKLGGEGHNMPSEATTRPLEHDRPLQEEIPVDELKAREQAPMASDSMPELKPLSPNSDNEENNLPPLVVDDDDFSQVDEENNDDMEELTDEDFDNEDDEVSYAQLAFKTNKHKTIEGVIEDFKKSDEEFMFVMKKGKSGTFYLKKHINNGNMDSILGKARKGVRLKVEYNPDDTETTDDGVDVYLITDLIDIDLDLDSGIEYTDVDEPDDSEKKKPTKRKKSKGKKSFPNLLKLNNKIGDMIYHFLAFPFGFFLKIPFLGKFIGKSKIVWKYLCRLWLVLIILMLALLFGRHGTADANSFNAKSGNINVSVIEPVYDASNNTIKATVKNNRKVYAYYYVKATVIKKGVIPFTKKTIACSGPSIGQAINAQQSIVLKCNGESLKKADSYTFDIHNNN